jgi:Domain of unknown function (DUF4124)
MCSAVLALAAASAFAATVYKWVDEKGVTHYSDQPHPNAQSLDVKSAQSYQSSTPAPAGSSNSSSNAPTEVPYQRCEVYRPENDEVFLNTDTVVAKVRIEPRLRDGDRLGIGLDGRRVQTGGSTELTLKVERGTHQLDVIVEDRTGKVVCQAATVKFHVRQPSVQAPNRANRPRF